MSTMPLEDPEKLETQPKLQRSRSIIKEFSLNTSTHGLPGIARSQSIHNCLFWTVSSLIFTGVMLYFVVQSIAAYYQYPLQTLVSFDGQWPQAFPAVTICNYSPLRYDRFIGPFVNYTNTFNLTNTTDANQFSQEQSRYIDEYLHYKLNRNEPLDEFYYPLKSMLMSCVYNGDNCSATDFIQFRSAKYGMCYTFNAQSNHINDGKLHYNNENGYSGELTLRLYAHRHQYVPFYFDGESMFSLRYMEIRYRYVGTGIVIMVHDNMQLPLMERVAIQLTPGRKHKFGYYKRTNFLLSSPYTTCSDKVTTGMQAMFDEFSDANYTYGQEICFKVAIQTYTYQECNCVSPFEWAARHILVPGTATIVHASLCNISDRCYSDAAERFQSTASISDKYGADCGLECFSTEFPLKQSAVLAPPDWFMHSIKQFVESSSIPVPTNWSSTWPSEIQANYIGVDIVCESTRVESYTQQATLSGIDVLSNVGGQTGLWIGISFLSLMEIAEMLYRLIRYQCHRARERLRKPRVRPE